MKLKKDRLPETVIVTMTYLFTFLFLVVFIIDNLSSRIFTFLFMTGSLGLWIYEINTDVKM